MMKRILKWLGLGLGLLVALLVGAAGLFYAQGAARLNKVYDVPGESLPLPSDEVALARGRHLVEHVSLCSGCHGPTLAGQIFLDEPPLGQIPAPNLTSGRGGLGQSYSDADWERAIRHGLNAQGQTLIIMPSEALQTYSDADVAAIMAYLKSVPPVDNELPKRSLTPLLYGLVGAGQFNALTAELIDHTKPRPPAPAIGVSAEYGEYLTWVGGCQICHGQGLVGRTPGEGEPPPAGPNLTPQGPLGRWSEHDFVTALRTGARPDGSLIIPDEMPWPAFSGSMSG
ncbi:MAG: cytochrome c [Anaerolineae bacterium]